MNRFAFKLDSVLRFRELQERQAEAREQRSISLLRHRESAADALRRRLQELTQAPGFLNLTLWQAQGRTCERVGRALAEAEGLVQEAVRLVQEANAVRLRRARDAEVLRQLRQRNLHNHRRQLGKREQRMLDDISMRRWSERPLEDRGE